MNYNEAADLIATAQKITIIQAENADADSLGTSLALEELLGDQGKTPLMYCPVIIPRHLHYVKGWDRVTDDFDFSSDMVIIVDTAADILLTKLLEQPGARHYLETHPVLVIDHHVTQSTLSFPHHLLSEDAVATGEIIYQLASANDWQISAQAAENMLIAIMADSLGLTTQQTTPQSFFVAGKLTELGASNAAIEGRRREFMKKAPEILAYKGELIQRIEYALDGRLALIHIPWSDIQKYSDRYNPSVLVLDEMRLVKGVDVAIAVKTYPDGKATGKIRSNLPVAEHIAGYFGGGGHSYASGFRVYEEYATVITEILDATQKAFDHYEAETQ